MDGIMQELCIDGLKHWRNPYNNAEVLSGFFPYFKPDKTLIFPNFSVSLCWRRSQTLLNGVYFCHLMAHLGFWNIVIEFNNGKRYVMPIKIIPPERPDNIYHFFAVHNGKEYEASQFADIENMNGELVGHTWRGFVTHFNMDDLTIRKQVFTK